MSDGGDHWANEARALEAIRIADDLQRRHGDDALKVARALARDMARYEATERSRDYQDAVALLERGQAKVKVVRG